MNTTSIETGAETQRLHEMWEIISAEKLANKIEEMNHAITGEGNESMENRVMHVQEILKRSSRSMIIQKRFNELAAGCNFVRQNGASPEPWVWLDESDILYHSKQWPEYHQECAKISKEYPNTAYDARASHNSGSAYSNEGMDLLKQLQSDTNADIRDETVKTAKSLFDLGWAENLRARAVIATHKIDDVMLKGKICHAEGGYKFFMAKAAEAQSPTIDTENWQHIFGLYMEALQYFLKAADIVMLTGEITNPARSLWWAASAKKEAMRVMGLTAGVGLKEAEEMAVRANALAQITNYKKAIQTGQELMEEIAHDTEIFKKVFSPNT